MRFLKKIFPAIIRRWKLILKHFDFFIQKKSAYSSLIAGIYYTFFNNGFSREHKAMISGKIKFRESKSSIAETSSLLRRNIHRLEKGIISKPRRDTFGLDYIKETYYFYKKQVNIPKKNRCSSDEELRWARDVLEEYFNITADHPKIVPLKEDFKCFLLKEKNKTGEDKIRPYFRDLNKPIDVDYDSLLKLAWRRRSVRWFIAESVPRTLIEKAIDVATLSPSACNRQPFLFRIFDDPDLVKKVAALPGGTVGFAHQFPVIIVIIGELRNYYGERDKHLIYIDASLAAMSFVFAAETLGLGTCCINWPDIEEYERKAEKLLKLEPDQRPIMFLAVGFPDPEGMVAYSQKKPTHQIAKYNFE